MGCGASSSQANSTEVPQQRQAEPSGITTNEQQQNAANKKPESTAGKIGSPNYTGKPGDSFMKLSKVSNPEDGTDKDKDKKQPQTSGRYSNSLHKQGSLMKSSTHQQPTTTSQQQIPAPSTIYNNKKGQLQNTVVNNNNSKITLSPSKVSIRMAESHAVAPNGYRTTTEGDTISKNNDRKGQTGYGTTSAIAGVAGDSRIQEDAELDDHKKKTLKSSKKKGSVDPKLNALIKIYGFD